MQPLEESGGVLLQEILGALRMIVVHFLLLRQGPLGVVEPESVNSVDNMHTHVHLFSRVFAITSRGIGGALQSTGLGCLEITTS